jgi:hypothetical protein
MWGCSLSLSDERTDPSFARVTVSSKKSLSVCTIYILHVIKCSQTYVHTAGPLVPVPSPFKVETAIAKLKMYKSPGSG